MAKWEIWKPLPLICGFLLGTVGMIMLGKAILLMREYPKDNPSGGNFGDIEIRKVRSTRPDENGLAMTTKGYLVAIIERDKLGTTKEIHIFDGNERELVRGTFKESKLNEIYLFTNNKSEEGKLHVQRSSVSNLWQHAYYGKFVKGKENYFEDIDFDGQFDIKGMRDESLKTSDAYIFLDNNWQEVSSIDPNVLHAYAVFVDGKFQRLSDINAELRKKISSLPKDATKKVHYDFESGKGWKKRD